MPSKEDAFMGGPPIDITPQGDLLVWGGLAFLALLGLASALAPRFLRRRRST
jgi:hypothetical protein